MVNLQSSTSKLARLNDTSRELSELCNLVESREDFDERLDGMFKELVTRHVDAVTALGQMTNLAKGFLEVCKKERAEIAKAENVYSTIVDRIKSRLVQALDTRPDLPWRNWNGGKLYLQSNPPRLELDCGEKKYIYYAIEHDEMQVIPARYIKEITYFVLDRETILEDLRAGVEIPFARILQDRHVRGI